MNEEMLEKLLQLLERQKFAKWYGEGGRFDAYCRGEENCPTREQIKDDLRRMIGA